jgi:hypothetical protein
MLSSRCNDSFPPGAATTLSDIRRELKTQIEAMEIAGRKAFDVWINEETDPQGGTWDSWDVCIEAVKDCDILLVISNGNAGWAEGSGEIGICHAEMMTALSTAPAKVRSITVDEIPVIEDEAGKRNKRFQDYIASESLFRGATVSTVDQLKSRTTDALHDAVISLAQAGVRDASRGKFHSRAALSWTRLDFSERQSAMVRVLRDAVKARSGAFEESTKLFVRVGGCDILTEPHAIPAALTVGPARELVGQPFLKYHLVAASLTHRRGGPLHIIACHRTATETQASRMLGFPDATFVSATFGVFVANPIQRVQFAFITNCRDEANTRHGVQRFFEWMTQTGEDKLVAKRAQARARIVRAMAKGTSA